MSIRWSRSYTILVYQIDRRALLKKRVLRITRQHHLDARIGSRCLHDRRTNRQPTEVFYRAQGAHPGSYHHRSGYLSKILSISDVFISQTEGSGKYRAPDHLEPRNSSVKSARRCYCSA